MRPSVAVFLQLLELQAVVFVLQLPLLVFRCSAITPINSIVHLPIAMEPRLPSVLWAVAASLECVLYRSRFAVFRFPHHFLFLLLCHLPFLYRCLFLLPSLYRFQSPYLYQFLFLHLSPFRYQSPYLFLFQFLSRCYRYPYPYQLLFRLLHR
jgi:hypothetical protein